MTVPAFRIRLDLEAERLRIDRDGRTLALRGKSVSFLCLLMTLPDGRYADRELVHRLPRWSGMTQESVGKQIARLDAQWQRAGFELLQARNRTNGWRLSQPVLQAVDDPTRAAAAAMLDAVDWSHWSRFARVPATELAAWALDTAEAGFLMTAGQAEAGYRLLRHAYEATEHADLMAIADVLASRIGQRLDSPHLPLPLARLQGHSLFDTAVEVRRQAAYAINAESGSWAAHARTLRTLLPTVVATGDMTSQAILHNALAMLMRRLGQLPEALAHMREAVPLAVFAGDHWLIQAALFNLANILSELRRSGASDVPTETIFALLEADRSIRKRFGIGQDSAQAELLLAYLALEADMPDRAEAYLGEADAIVAVSRATADAALAARIRGLLCRARGDHAQAQACLGRAIDLFERAGNKASAEWVRSELAAVPDTGAGNTRA